MWHTLAQIGPGPRVNNKRLFPPGLLCDKGITVRSVLTPFFITVRHVPQDKLPQLLFPEERKGKLLKKKGKKSSY